MMCHSFARCVFTPAAAYLSAIEAEVPLLDSLQRYITALRADSDSQVLRLQVEADGALSKLLESVRRVRHT